MTQLLQDIVGKLYKPPVNGMRQVFALSRGDAEKLPRLPSIAVISVTAPERPLARVDGFTAYFGERDQRFRMKVITESGGT
ncbi:hypothetical protein [Burkholderia multivorans]|uniref:hypothetical protein n=1 Tax=Burkholderia multivorans TaxID=87883 RepID=UPI0021C1507B|nr:hypothetical protein [Burkholderia multivorans]